MLCQGKVNLFLKVTGKRPDGYHALETLFLPLPGEGDTLEFAEGDPGIRCTVEGTGEIPDNLVCRAAKRYAGLAEIRPAWDFTLAKRLPVAAGLGGGSSDAAGALLLLNRRYEAFSCEELASMALTLGADVPFFLHSRPAWAEGIGEKFSFLDGVQKFPPVLVANPRFPVSARWAYTHLAPENIGPADGTQKAALEQALLRGDWEDVAANLHNDLGIALYRKFPVLKMMRETMIAGGALNAEISGSGSSLFAVCASGEDCFRVQKALETQFGKEVLRILIFCGGRD